VQNETENPVWLQLAKMVDIARLHGAELRPFRYPNSEPNAFVVTLGEQSDLTSRSLGDEFGYAERMMVLWADRAHALQQAGAKHARKPEFAWHCVVCHAGPGQTCRPTHEGEREGGTWIHPLRKVKPTRDNDAGDPKALAAARQFLNQEGELYRYFIGGRAPGFRKAVEILCTEVIRSENLRVAGVLYFAQVWKDQVTEKILALLARPDTATGPDLDAMIELTGIVRNGENEPDAVYRNRILAALEAQRTPSD
jgi:hypothetical protein